MNGTILLTSLLLASYVISTVKVTNSTPAPPACNKRLLQSYGLDSLDTPNTDCILCPASKSNCCTKKDQIRLHKLWHMHVKTLVKPHHKMNLAALKHLEKVVKHRKDLKIDDLAKAFYKAHPKANKMFRDKLKQVMEIIKEMDHKKLKAHYEKMNKKMKKMTTHVNSLRKGFLCSLCNHHNHLFINGEEKSMTYSTAFCSALVSKHISSLKLKYEFFEYLASLSELITLLTEQDVFAKKTLEYYNKFIPEVKACAKAPGIKACEKVCAEFNINKFSLMWDGEKKPIEDFMANYMKLYEDLMDDEKRKKIFKYTPKNWKKHDIEPEPPVKKEDKGKTDKKGDKSNKNEKSKTGDKDKNKKTGTHNKKTGTTQTQQHHHKKKKSSEESSSQSNNNNNQKNTNSNKSKKTGTAQARNLHQTKDKKDKDDDNKKVNENDKTKKDPKGKGKESKSDKPKKDEKPQPIKVSKAELEKVKANSLEAQSTVRSIVEYAKENPMPKKLKGPCDDCGHGDFALFQTISPPLIVSQFKIIFANKGIDLGHDAKDCQLDMSKEQIITMLFPNMKKKKPASKPMDPAVIEMLGKLNISDIKTFIQDADINFHKSTCKKKAPKSKNKVDTMLGVLVETPEEKKAKLEKKKTGDKATGAKDAVATDAGAKDKAAESTVVDNATKK